MFTQKITFTSHSWIAPEVRIAPANWSTVHVNATRVSSASHSGTKRRLKEVTITKTKT